MADRDQMIDLGPLTAAEVEEIRKALFARLGMQECITGMKPMEERSASASRIRTLLSRIESLQARLTARIRSPQH